MLTTSWRKLAYRIACLAVLTSAALWLNAPVHADGFTCVLSANNNTGGMVYISCGSSAGDTLWNCAGGGSSCTSDPQMDYAAGQECDKARANGCPDVYYAN